MKPLSNIKVYDLEESLRASGYSMRVYLLNYMSSNRDLVRAKQLVKASRFNSAHAQFLSTVVVNFDLTFSNKCCAEAERYKFLTFGSSK